MNVGFNLSGQCELPDLRAAQSQARTPETNAEPSIRRLRGWDEIRLFTTNPDSLILSIKTTPGMKEGDLATGL